MAKTARDIMETPVLTVSPQDPLDAVQRFFFDEGIHGAPVVDDERRVLGVISTTDVLRVVTERADAARPHVEYASDGTENGYVEAVTGGVVAEEIMTDSVVSVDGSAPISTIVEAFLENRVHRVLVVDDGYLEGIISSLDLLALMEPKS